MTENETLLALYRKTFEMTERHADKAWESIKFHVLLSSSLTSITIGSIVAIHTSSVFLGLNNWYKAFLTSVLIVLPVAMLLVLRVGSNSFKRECRRMYQQIAIIMKLEETFGFERSPEWKRKHFSKEDKYLLPEWDKEKWKTTKEFVCKMMQSKRRFYQNMNGIFKIFKWVSIALITSIIIIVLIAIHF